jgi:pimeloyl-ACP methyl ester carboxylesterase
MPDRSLLTWPRVEGTVSLVGRRRLGFAEFGDPRGRAVVWLHGTPGARRQIPESARIAAVDRGVRLIGLDRPGVGDSSPHLYDRILDFADDLRHVVDQLGVEDFGLIGLSGGGPYVLATAYAMPERVGAALIMGGVAPSVGPEAPGGSIVALARIFQPALAGLRTPLAFGLASAVRAARPFADPAIRLYARLSPEGDRRVFARPEIKAMFLDDLLNGSRPGLRAPIYDAVLFGRPWGFDVADVHVPVDWWHGDADHIIPLRHGQHMTQLLPQARLHVRRGESHLGSFAEAEWILSTLLATWDRRQLSSVR